MWWFLSLLRGELSIVYCSTLGQVVNLEEISVLWDVVFFTTTSIWTQYCLLLLYHWPDSINRGYISRVGCGGFITTSMWTKYCILLYPWPDSIPRGDVSRVGCGGFITTSMWTKYCILLYLRSGSIPRGDISPVRCGGFYHYFEVN